MRSLWRHRYNEQRARVNAEGLINERKCRICAWDTTPAGRLRFTVQMAEYRQFLVTNHLVANSDARSLLTLRESGESELADALEQAFTSDGLYHPRGALCPTEDRVRVSPTDPCSNHLGASLMLVSEVESGAGSTVPVFVCPPSRGQVSSPNDIIMTASGSIDWPLREDAVRRDKVPAGPDIDRPHASLAIGSQVWREFGEECLAGTDHELRMRELPLGQAIRKRTQYGLRMKKKYLQRAELINFCSNVERGGKPELFYVAGVREPGTEFLERTFRFNWELIHNWDNEVITDPGRHRARRTTLLLPSPIDRDLQLIDRPKKAFDTVIRVVTDNKFNPVFRAHLVSILRMCVHRYPRARRYARSWPGRIVDTPVLPRR
ncbi:MAG: hypothetical protein AAGH64_07500, partial [Planctomycetota bacterium]